MTEQLTRTFEVLVTAKYYLLFKMLYKEQNAMMYCIKVYSARDRKSFSGAKPRQNKEEARLRQKLRYELPLA